MCNAYHLKQRLLVPFLIFSGWATADSISNVLGIQRSATQHLKYAMSSTNIYVLCSLCTAHILSAAKMLSQWLTFIIVNALMSAHTKTFARNRYWPIAKTCGYFDSFLFSSFRLFDFFFFCHSMIIRGLVLRHRRACNFKWHTQSAMNTQVSLRRCVYPGRRKIQHEQNTHQKWLLLQ